MVADIVDDVIPPTSPDKTPMTCSLPSASTGNDSVLLRNSYGRVIVNDSCRFEPGTIGKVGPYPDPAFVKQLPDENEPGGAKEKPGYDQRNIVRLF